jgi:putative gamma-D-glutamyl-L-diamino acid endopeptidase-like protein/SH3 domain containing protein/NlpC/P60 family protein
MTGFARSTRLQSLISFAVICVALALAACSAAPKKVTTTMTSAGPAPSRDVEIQDLSRIPQDLAPLAALAGDRIAIGAGCREQLLEEFKKRYFSRWTSSAPLYDSAESRDFMNKEIRGAWYGTNKRKVPRKQMQEFLENCALDSFPSRNDTAIAVAPGHLRGLPTHLPFYERSDGAPFDMLSNPQLKLNEPLRVLHTSKDGVWLFVENGYSNGWLEKRDVALVDAEFIDSWMRAPHLVMVRDYQPVSDGRGVGTYPAKIGTILPLAQEGKEYWEVKVASAGEGGKAEIRPSRIPREAAAPFPLTFSKENVVPIGNQLLGQLYGWGESYALRDCSALLRDFFLPFGIWLPRTSADQIASLPQRLELAALAPAQKEEAIRSKGLPFLSLVYKPGHIMLYAGEDKDGRPLVFHSAWSIALQEGEGRQTKVVGISAVTSMEPGKELGLAPGRSLLERATELGTVTNRCLKHRP